mmetsp:Transcript_12044/g.17660  ORF Transcript_12044/g.17660 Transcript_12044/m.17660 type:complete len:555 (+) Transcript_12044:27-1691(+)
MKALICICVITLSCLFHVSSERVPPNIVLLLADNLGYNDISIFGAPSSQTPHIDRLGLEGLKLNNWNSAAHLCSASRAAILTGRYPAKMGIFPRVFRVDAEYGLLPKEITLAEYLRDKNYSTSIVGKWHLGHRPEYLPTNQGFDEWTGIPYHMSGGSVDGHECFADTNRSMWLPLYENEKIVEQPVNLETLAKRYADRATSFIERNAKKKPFFLFMSFSHVHQLCAPKFGEEQASCQWSKRKNGSDTSTFVDAVEEMDWIAGQILQKLDNLKITNETLVLFTSDNGPWVAEQECSGSKGAFEGRWLYDNTDRACTACPSDYLPISPSNEEHICILPGTNRKLKGVPCGADTGLGSVWEANLRMPALVRWPGQIQGGTESMAIMSSLDVVPTILSIVKQDIPDNLDGMDLSSIWLDPSRYAVNTKDRVLFFWRDGFKSGPLPSPYGRFDVAAIKIGDRIKVWLWTKSSHYNEDVEMYHDPPLLFDVLSDPGEAFPLSADDYPDLVARIPRLVAEHKKSIPQTFPLALYHSIKYIPCSNKETNCRTSTSLSDIELA